MKFYSYSLKLIVSFSRSWYDGFSTFQVNSNGVVSLHVADKVRFINCFSCIQSNLFKFFV
jgi:hypothetical protein